LIGSARVLTDEQQRLYARHILLDQLGTAGQARLCAARATAQPQSDPRAAAVALDYLARAGVQIDPDSARHEVPHEVPHEAPAASPEALHALAGDAALLECAAWLSGAFAAVEVIKQIVAVGTEGRLDPELVLTAEVI
jgi:hypothetical protein